MDASIKFQNQIKKSDEHYRKLTFNEEEKVWKEKLKLLKSSALVPFYIKCEPVISEPSDNEQIDNGAFECYVADSDSSPSDHEEAPADKKALNPDDKKQTSPIKDEKPKEIPKRERKSEEKLKKEDEDDQKSPLSPADAWWNNDCNWWENETATEQPPTKKIKSKQRSKEGKRLDYNYLNKTYKCDYCFKVFVNYHAWRSHLRQHKKKNENLGIPCSKCDQTFLFEASLERHINKCHPTVEPLICDVSLTFTKDFEYFKTTIF